MFQNLPPEALCVVCSFSVITYCPVSNPNRLLFNARFLLPDLVKDHVAFARFAVRCFVFAGKTPDFFEPDCIVPYWDSSALFYRVSRSLHYPNPFDPEPMPFLLDSEEEWGISDTEPPSDAPELQWDSEEEWESGSTSLTSNASGDDASRLLPYSIPYMGPPHLRLPPLRFGLRRWSAKPSNAPKLHTRPPNTKQRARASTQRNINATKLTRPSQPHVQPRSAQPS